jgi:para-nitrobenzyl esterase
VGRQNDVPTLTGLNADEGSASPTYGKIAAADFKEQAQERYAGQADAYLALYPARAETEASRSQKEAARDQGVVSMSLWAAHRARTAATPAYLYYFDRAMPWPEHPEFGAHHTGEVPYVFDTLDKLDRPWEPADRVLADRMSSYWANFVTRGDPNGDDLPAWPTYSERPDAVMVLGTQPGPSAMPDAEKRAFFEAVWASEASQ